MPFSHLAHDCTLHCPCFSVRKGATWSDPGAMLANDRLHRPFTTVLAPAECHVETRKYTRRTPVRKAQIANY